jgi:hypothetical protein
MGERFLSYAARHIRDKGVCPACFGWGRPYKKAEPAPTVSTGAPEQEVVACPQCGREWDRLVALRRLSRYATTARRDNPMPSSSSSPQRSGSMSGKPAPDPAGSAFDTSASAGEPASGTSNTDLQPARRRFVRLSRLISFDHFHESSKPADLGQRQKDAPSQPVSVLMDRSHVLGIDMGQRRVEPMGSEQHDFDNSKSSTTSVETLQISHTSQFEIRLDEDRATTKDGERSVSCVNMIKIIGQLQSNIRQAHSHSATSTLVVQRTSQISIPPRTHVRVIIHWKRIWQDGRLHLMADRGLELAIPYSVTTDLAFDKTTIDVTS